MFPEWLDAERLQIAGLGTLVVLAIVALLVMRFVRRLVMKGFWLLLLVAAGFAVWTQRADLADCQTTCSCSLFGREVAVPDSPVCGPDRVSLESSGLLKFTR
ncbi:MAG: hypothetical protein ACKVHU_18905 [Acidimicrobiales bacterium]|jgi:hypothetical protein